jgi:drug/metabolite transporter (DMT)-like permease
MSTLRIAALTTLAMLAFAGNSILCRIALKETGIDAASFTTIRLASGAAVLWAITMFFGRDRQGSGNWLSALALFTYAAGFSFAYISLTAATGALMLFGAVQVTMIGYGLWAGERLQKQQLFGFALAFGGLIGLLLPGLSAPPLLGSALMLLAGMAWGVYSIRGSIGGKGAGDATRVTAGNFSRASLLAVLLSALMFSDFKADSAGLGYAVASGAITSGLGYAVWYSVVPELKATLAILGGIALVILSKPRG